MKFIKFADLIIETTSMSLEKIDSPTHKFFDGKYEYYISIANNGHLTGYENFENQKERNKRFQELEDMLIPKTDKLSKEVDSNILKAAVLKFLEENNMQTRWVDEKFK